jgi:hypothetical protein
MVPKNDGSLRVVQDFGEPNVKSMEKKYSMKNVKECIGNIGRAGSSIFSTLDLTSGIWQMPLNKQSQHLTAFTVPGLGQFEWIVVSPIGLLGCQVSFQRLLKMAMRILINLMVYIDGLLLLSESHAEHQEKFKNLFCRIRNTGLRANLAKCELPWLQTDTTENSTTDRQTQSCSKL